MGKNTTKMLQEKKTGNVDLYNFQILWCQKDTELIYYVKTKGEMSNHFGLNSNTLTILSRLLLYVCVKLKGVAWYNWFNQQVFRS